MMMRLLLWAVLSLPLATQAFDAPKVPEAKASPEVLMSYRRLLPLEGGSNFRDIGGYPTEDGRVVKRGLLFRSGAMTGLTENDADYLDDFGFRSVIDLRSSEELDLFPNRWAKEADLRYVHHDYSMLGLMKQAVANQVPAEDGGDGLRDYSGMYMYMYMMDLLKPQLNLYFDTLINGEVPAVVNCSAGQDRTGVTSALLLSVLGVDRDLIVEDYLLSTDFRRPLNEQGDVDLNAAATDNAFAAVMLQYIAGNAHPERPNPLVTAEGKPFVLIALEAIEARWGSVDRYLAQEVGLTPAKKAQLKAMYLE